MNKRGWFENQRKYQNPYPKRIILLPSTKMPDIKQNFAPMIGSWKRITVIPNIMGAIDLCATTSSNDFKRVFRLYHELVGTARLK